MSEPVIQREKIIAVIEAEAKLIAEDVVEQCRNPGHCAIGALLFAAGCSNVYLRTLSVCVDDWTSRHKASKVLRDSYGLTMDEAGEIVSANDAFSTSDDADEELAERRARVIAKVTELADAQAARLAAEVTP